MTTTKELREALREGTGSVRGLPDRKLWIVEVSYRSRAEATRLYDVLHRARQKKANSRIEL